MLALVQILLSEILLLIKEVVGFEGELIFDIAKPDGTPRKLMDIGVLTDLGWSAQTSLLAGLKLSYYDFLERN